MKKLLLLFGTLSLFISATDVNLAPQMSVKPQALHEEQWFYSIKSPTSCTLENQNKYVYQALHDSYLWKDNVPFLDSTKHYESPEQLLKSLKNENDLFSHIVDLKKANGFFGNGKFNNFGFIPFLVQLKNGEEALTVVFVYPNSPAQRAGLKRGDIITKIDHISTNASNLKRIKKRLKTHHKIVFTFWDEKKRYKKTIVKYDYAVHTISHVKIYHIENKKVGYMVLSDFIPSEKDEINRLFTRFKSAKLDDLIIDLRYNGGGDTIIADHIGSLIGGVNLSNKVSTHYLFNAKYKHLNYTSYFEDFNDNQLNLNRLVVITSERTCSASEQLIKNLRASDSNMEVIQIGQKTCGKPYAYNSLGLFCNKALFLINTKAQNSDHNMIAQNGLVPTCSVADNIYKNFGDRSENSLKEALHYITNNQCSSETTTHSYSVINSTK
ncbi:MAG: PDZ domain-containing protein [Sulfurovaceae bacterium]|nr:PDZ domain-containing protein [Sulfurovaceae bacterium]